MYKFGLIIKDATRVSRILSKCKDDYLSIYLTSRECWLVGYNPSHTTVAKFELFKPENVPENEISYFRISKNKLVKLLMNGRVDVLVDDVVVTLTFVDENSNYSYTYQCKKQPEVLANFYDIVDILENYKENGSNRISNISPIIRTSKSIKSDITVHGGLAYTSDDTVGIYQNFGDKDLNFCLLPESVEALLRVSNTVYNTRLYVVAQTKDFIIIAQKRKILLADSFGYVSKQGAIAKITFDSNPIINLLNKLELKEGDFLIDFNTRTAKLVIDELNTFTVKFSLKDISKATDAVGTVVQLPVVKITYRILTKILNIVKPGVITLFIKKDHIQINMCDLTDSESLGAIGDTFVIFRR